MKDFSNDDEKVVYLFFSKDIYFKPSDMKYLINQGGLSLGEYSREKVI